MATGLTVIVPAMIVDGKGFRKERDQDFIQDEKK